MFDETVAMKKINEMFEQYVPMSGKADTVGGEIVRAICRIGYRWFNDGDQVGVGYGNETCNAAARYLMNKCPDEIADAVWGIWGCYSEKVYDAGLNVLEELIVDYLEKNPDLFNEKNDEDMWDCREWEDTHYEDEDDEEEYWEEEEEE